MAARDSPGRGDSEERLIADGRVIHGDCIDELRKLDENSIDAVVTDPPYGLAFMGKEWDDFAPKEYQEFCEEWGAEVLRVLKPGGFLLAFSGTRTYHRMVTGLQDAGFEIRDMINWMYGTGFPRGYNFKRFSEEWAGWGTTLKPAHEPVVVAQNPRDGTYQNNVEQYGCGGLHIDACRIGEETITQRPSIAENNIYGQINQEKEELSTTTGRWPANVILDGKAARQLDLQTGELSSGVLEDHHNVQSRMTQHCYGEFERSNTSDTYGDSGGASRFFYCAKAAKSERNAGLSSVEPRTVSYAGHENNEDDDVTERFQNAHENDIATLKPINLMRYLVRLVTPPNGTVLDPFAGSGTTGCACEVEDTDYVLIEKRERFAEEIIPARLEHWAAPENHGELKEHNAL